MGGARPRGGGAWLVGFVVAASAIFGGLGTVVGLVKAFGALGGESVDPSQKARIPNAGEVTQLASATALLLVFNEAHPVLLSISADAQARLLAH